MPYECEDNRDVYNDYMSKIVAFCNGLTVHAYLLLAILTQIFRKPLYLGAFYMIFAMIFLSRLPTRIVFLQRRIRM